MQTRHPISCVAVFVHNGNKEILIGTRLQKTTKEGVPEYCLPGGKIDWMESAEEAAIRETREESDIEIELESFLGYTNDRWQDLDVHCTTLYFQARIISGTPTAVEKEKLGEWKWVKADQCPPLFADCHTLISKLHI